MDFRLPSAFAKATARRNKREQIYLLKGRKQGGEREMVRLRSKDELRRINVFLQGSPGTEKKGRLRSESCGGHGDGV